ncbi:conserved hypothetical protein [Hyella patelloides LEGE 07179]|uniref:PEP-CTERM protein-sorting domain-containing protein n=1 Tax=Hyella patelloides LEGE 07179 TaxID=945734 RepID=A0A563VWW8_9CYAN|nr:PEP-CTERM sorting domain-containing protein [Hyella patelloides]VEP15954.1 conserved hypothetical protein [Hyella patelloides LEGE 07179]
MTITQNSFSNVIKTSLLTGSILALSATSSYAVGLGKYRLHNHPNGNVAAPYYGLRLDGLLTRDTKEEYTFDFNHNDSKVFLNYNADDTISITGQAFGGEDIGSSYKAGTTGVWDIDFTYESVTQAGSDDDVIAFVGEGNISSTINSVNYSFDLNAEQGNFPFAFRLGDKNNDRGYRGYDGISGWGWINHAPDTTAANDALGANHIKSSDWLFTAKQVSVPEPTAILGLLGVTSLGLISKKKRK